MKKRISIINLKWSFQASREVLFDAMHMWLILENCEEFNNSRIIPIVEALQKLNLSVDADIVIASKEGNINNRNIFSFKKSINNILIKDQKCKKLQYFKNRVKLKQVIKNNSKLKISNHIMLFINFNF